MIWIVHIIGLLFFWPLFVLSATFHIVVASVVMVWCATYYTLLITWKLFTLPFRMVGGVYRYIKN